MADPPIMDLHGADGGQVHLILFGARNRSYHLEGATRIDSGPAGWLSWGASTGNMTNTFRILPSFPATEPEQFFRAKEE